MTCGQVFRIFSRNLAVLVLLCSTFSRRIRNLATCRQAALRSVVRPTHREARSYGLFGPLPRWAIAPPGYGGGCPHYLSAGRRPDSAPPFGGAPREDPLRRRHGACEEGMRRAVGFAQDPAPSRTTPEDPQEPRQRSCHVSCWKTRSRRSGFVRKLRRTQPPRSASGCGTAAGGGS